MASATFLAAVSLSVGLYQRCLHDPLSNLRITVLLENAMAIMDFIKKQFIDVIHWTEESDGVLAYRYPMQDLEIQNGVC